jgi:hypothetical protein
MYLFVSTIAQTSNGQSAILQNKSATQKTKPKSIYNVVIPILLERDCHTHMHDLGYIQRTYESPGLITKSEHRLLISDGLVLPTVRYLLGA